MSNFRIRGNDAGTGTTTLASANTDTSTTFFFPPTDGTAGQFITTDGAGNLVFTSDITGDVITTGNVQAGNVISTGILTVTGNVAAGNLSGTNIAGTLTTAAQPNITGVGTLGSLGVTGNITLGTTGADVANVVSSLRIGTNAREKVTISYTGAGNTINFDVIDQGIVYLTANATGNWTTNIRANSAVTLDNYLSTGDSVTVALITTQGSTAYLQTNLQIDGANVTPRWQGGAAPTAGNAGNLDVYVINTIKTAANTWTALASATQFG